MRATCIIIPVQLEIASEFIGMVITSQYCPSCGAHNPIDADICFACNHDLHAPVHDVLLHNRYHLLQQVGKGGFGAVHKAEDTHEQKRLVAIKQINLRGLTPQEIIEATDGFNREVALLSTLSHPHLPHIYEHFTDPDHWYLVMDFLEGETLETYLEKTYTKRSELTPLPLTEVLDIGIQLCKVLDYLHTREPAIIFRDVKPANVMRLSTSKLYLIDFGIARHYKPGKPKDTIPFGSPGYAAPEQYGKAQTTPRSDIYSLGAMLHMLLSGNDPVDNPFHFDPLRLYGGEGISELTALIGHMVSLDAEQRPQCVSEVQKTLQAISDVQNNARILPILATPPPPPPTPVQITGNGLGQRMQQVMMQRRQLRQQRQQYWSYNRRKSRRLFVIGACSVGALALVGGSVSWLQQLPSSIECSCGSVVSTAGPSASLQSPHPLSAPLPPGAEVQSVSWSPDGMHVALAADATICVQEANTNILESPYTGKVLKIGYVTEAISVLSWQPENSNGKVYSLAFASGKTLNLWSGPWSAPWTDPQGTLKETHYQLEAQREPRASHDQKVSIGCLAWSLDGKYIAFPFANGVQIWNANTRTHVKNLHFSNLISSQSSTAIVSLSWSVDGKYIAAALDGVEPVFWRIADGQIYPNTDTSLLGSVVAWSPNGQFLAIASDSKVYVIAPGNDPISSNNITSPYQTFYTGHTGYVTALSWSPDGRYIASGSADEGFNLHVWSPFQVGDSRPPQTPNVLGNPTPDNPYILHTYVAGGFTGVHSVCWSPDQRCILVGTNDGYVIGIDGPM